MNGARSFEGLLGLLLILRVLLHAVVGPETSVRNADFLPEMVNTAAYDAFDPNPGFVDGTTLRTPPEGTIPRGLMPLMVEGRSLDHTDTAWKDLPADERAAWNALAPDWDWAALDEAARRAIVARGKTVFQNTCTACHDPAATGGAAVTKRGVPPPPSLLRPETVAMTDGQMFRGLTAGQGNMAAHANLVPRADRWAVIRYVRSLQEAAR